MRVILLGVIFSLITVFVSLIPWCQNGEEVEEKNEVYLLESGDFAITDREFSEELELKRAAYPYGVQNNPDEYNILVIQLVDQLAEELVLRRAARDRGIFVTPEELKAEENYIRQDYPEDSFEKMLLENAISHDFWRYRLKLNLLFERLIDKDLRQKVEISPQEMVAGYNEIKNNSEEMPDEAELIKKIRMAKAEAEYPAWIKGLEEEYPVLINRVNVDRYLKSVKENKGGLTVDNEND
ncbi:MAG: hypothetical protein RBR67_03335 [Desulfobacterium sp.]|nr:hypothetical protein [Desulfobacterium sp.]